MLYAAAIVMTAVLPTPGPATNPAGGQIVVGDVFRDLDRAFEIRRPSPDWVFIKQARASRLNREACMAMFNPKTQGRFIIIVTEAGRLTLDDYGQLVIETMPFENKSVILRENVRIAGRPALRIKLRGRSAERAVTGLIHLVENAGFIYELTATLLKARAAAVEPDITQAVRSFRFLPDRRPASRPKPTGGSEFAGFDWKQTADTYQNASFRFRVQVGGSWRLAEPAERARMNPDALAALICREVPINQVYLAQPLGAVNYATWLKARLADYRRTMGMTDPDRTINLKIAGTAAVQYVYLTGASPGVKFQRALTVFRRDGICYQIDSWWLTGRAPDAPRVVRDSYRFFGFLSKEDQTRLAQELSRMDRGNAVGPKYCYRHGVFRDFTYGVRYAQPPGPWSALVGPEADQQVAGASLVLFSPRTRVSVALSAELVADLPHPTYHQFRLIRAGAAADTPVQTRNRDGLNLRISRFQQDVHGMAASRALVTAARGNRRAWLLVQAPVTHSAALERMLPAIIAGLQMPDHVPSARSVTAQGITDLRLGFQLRIDPGGWRAKPLAAARQVAAVQRGRVICLASASAEPGASGVQLVRRMFRALAAGNPDRAAPKRAHDTLAGRPAIRLRFDQLDQPPDCRLTVWLIRRGNTLYGFSVLAPQHIPPDTIADYRRFFSLVD